MAAGNKYERRIWVHKDTASTDFLAVTGYEMEDWGTNTIMREGMLRFNQGEVDIRNAQDVRRIIEELEAFALWLEEGKPAAKKKPSAG